MPIKGFVFILDLIGVQEKMSHLTAPVIGVQVGGADGFSSLLHRGRNLLFVRNYSIFREDALKLCATVLKPPQLEKSSML